MSGTNLVQYFRVVDLMVPWGMYGPVATINSRYVCAKPHKFQIMLQLRGSTSERRVRG